MERNRQTVIVGAGIGGLVCAVMLAARGHSVCVIEKESAAGGKARQIDVDGVPIDAGPTVFTMRSVFDSVFEAAGTRLDDHLAIRRADIVARHAWSDGSQLDLFADHERSCAAIRTFAGPRAESGFRSFSAEAKRIHDILDAPLLRNSKTYPPGLMWRIGLWRIGALLAIRPYESLWKVLHEHFEDPRLIQLFGRYTTYCGSSPFLTPATLMLIAHVEAGGVWAIEGGMSALAAALEQIGRQMGVAFRYGTAVRRIETANGRAIGVTLADGERIDAGQVVFNGDPGALASGLFGPQTARAVRRVPEKARSLSAFVWLAHARTSGFDLSHHNVFFSSDYPAEFRDIASGRPPGDPTAYVCALDRGAGNARDGRERLQVIVNAPANGDTCSYESGERERCTKAMLDRLGACGLTLEEPLPHRLVTPEDFSRLFPGTGGALYGRASHGWAASFLRPGSRTAIPGLYCAGGATHPGAGVPMAALSGIQASEAVVADQVSTPWFHRRDTAGGMSTRSAMTVPTG